MASETKTKQEITAGVMAQVLHDLNPARTVEQWKEHVIKHGNDPKAFFGENGEGLAEYEAFIRTYDKDTHARIRKQNTRSR